MHVGKVGFCGDLQYGDRPVSNLLANRVIPYVNMLDPLVIDRIASQVDCNFAVCRLGRFQSRYPIQAVAVS